MATIEMTAAQLQIFADASDYGAEIMMLNLLRYREQADYATHSQEASCSGREAFKRYAKLSIACIEACGGQIIFIGKALATLIGPNEEQWDDIFLVQYPSRNAFLPCSIPVNIARLVFIAKRRWPIRG